MYKYTKKQYNICEKNLKPGNKNYATKSRYGFRVLKFLNSNSEF